MKRESVWTTISQCRASLADLGLKIIIVRRAGGFWISKSDAETLRIIAENGVSALTAKGARQ